MNAIAVSLYDKFEDLAVLVDIVRKNWDEQYYISVCSNHPEANERVAHIKPQIDHFERGAQITYEPDRHLRRSEANLSYRLYDSIRTACRGAFSADDVDNVMHVHADAWPLDEERFETLVDTTRRRGAAVAFPAHTHKFLDKYPPGLFEDQFILFDADAARQADLFEHGTVDLPPTWIHEVLPMLCLSKFGWSGLYHYSTGSQRCHWDGTPSTEIKNDARPMFYDPEYGYLHLAREDFPEEYGKALQAHYLVEHDITGGEHVERLLDRHHVPTDRLFSQLDRYINELNDRLRWYGASVDTFGRDIRVVKDFLENQSKLEQVRTLFNARSDSGLNFYIHPVLEGVFETGKRMTGAEKRPRTPYNRYPDRFVDEMYAERLEADDFPEELRDVLSRRFDRTDR